MSAPSARRTPLRRLPLRARLVAGFVAAMVLVLGAAGTFVYWRVSYALDLRLDEDLRSAARALSPSVTDGGTLADDPALDRLPGARSYQVLDAGGAVLAFGTDLGQRPVLRPRQVDAARRAEVITDVGALLPASRRPLRLLAVPLAGPGPGRVLVVAARRDARDEALRELLGQLLIAGAGTLLVTSVVGERLASAALAPVERYRARAAEIAGGAVGVRLDVPAGRDDEVTRLGHTLNEVLTALEVALDRERQFTQDASHELRTPLTLLSTRVQLALTRPRSSAEHEATLRELARDLADLKRLAEQLLELGALGTDHAGGTTAVAVGCDALAVAAAVTGALDAGAPAPGAGPVPVAMSETRLRQVLTNLVVNAQLHGAEPVQAEVRLSGEVAVLTVTDAGSGIDPAFLSSATDRFSRAQGAQPVPGAGLGLSLVRAIVEADGGELRLCSAGRHHRFAERLPVACVHPDTGTTASVVLRLLSPPPAQPTPPPLEGRLPSSA